MFLCICVCVNVSVSACVSRWLTCVCYSGPLPKLPFGEPCKYYPKRKVLTPLAGALKKTLIYHLLVHIVSCICSIFIIFLVCFSTIIQPPAADLPAQEDPFSYQDLRDLNELWLRWIE